MIRHGTRPTAPVQDANCGANASHVTIVGKRGELSGQSGLSCNPRKWVIGSILQPNAKWEVEMFTSQIRTNRNTSVVSVLAIALFSFGQSAHAAGLECDSVLGGIFDMRVTSKDTVFTSSYLKWLPPTTLAVNQASDQQM